MLLPPKLAGPLHPSPTVFVLTFGDEHLRLLIWSRVDYFRIPNPQSSNNEPIRYIARCQDL